MLLRDRLAEWVVELTTRFKGTRGLRPRAVGLLARDDGARIRGRLRQRRMVPVRLLPHRAGRGRDDDVLPPVRSGGDPARGRGRSRASGRPVRARASSSEKQGIATGRPRNAHVVAVDDVTSLTFSAVGPVPVDGRAERPPLPDQIASVRGSDRRQREHVHRRLRLRRPQDPGDGRTSLAVPDRSRPCSPIRSSERCSASSTSSRSCRSGSCAPRSSTSRPERARSASASAR